MSFNVINAINNLSALFGGLSDGHNTIEAIDNLEGALINFAPNGGIQESVYLPVVTNIVNLTSVAPFNANFFKIGKLVTVSGLFFIDGVAGAPAACSFDVSIPVTTIFVLVSDGNGTYTVKPSAFTGNNCVAVPLSSTMQFTFNSVSGGPQGMSYTYTYRIQ